MSNFINIYFSRHIKYIGCTTKLHFFVEIPKKDTLVLFVTAVGIICSTFLSEKIVNDVSFFVKYF